MSVADPLASMHAPGPPVPRCSAPGCMAYAWWGRRGVWFCSVHRPADFMPAAKADASRAAARGVILTAPPPTS